MVLSSLMMKTSLEANPPAAPRFTAAELAADKIQKVHAVPAHVIDYVDSAVKKCLPAGTEVHGIIQSGASFWARTAKIEASDENGEETSFFIKVNHLESGKKITQSEFKCMSLLYSLIPDHVAEPIACGAYEELDDIYFYLTRFVEMPDAVPAPDEICDVLARMHEGGTSRTELFGTPFDVWGARDPVVFPRSANWEETYTAGLHYEFENEAKMHGKDDEAFNALRDEFMAKVVPRLLRPLQTEGRTILPTLVHGDLWDGNAAIDANSGRAYIFDACAFYAHNEYELSPWFCPRQQMGRVYIKEYFERIEPSEPAEDCMDRGLLYSMRFDLRASSIYPGTLKRRQLVADTMSELLAKYPLGYEGYLLERGLGGSTESKTVEAASTDMLKSANLRAAETNKSVDATAFAAVAETDTVEAIPPVAELAQLSV